MDLTLPHIRSQIPDGIVPDWFLGTGTQTIEYLLHLKQTRYSAPEYQELFSRLGIELMELYTAVKPYFLKITWDWPYWANVLETTYSWFDCKSGVLEELSRRYRSKELSLDRLDELLSRRSPTWTPLRLYLQIKQLPDGKYLDVDTGWLVSRTKKYSDSQYRITSHRILTHWIGSIQYYRAVRSALTLSPEHRYNLDTHQVVPLVEANRCSYVDGQLCGTCPGVFGYVQKLIAQERTRILSVSGYDLSLQEVLNIDRIPPQRMFLRKRYVSSDLEYLETVVGIPVDDSIESRLATGFSDDVPELSGSPTRS